MSVLGSQLATLGPVGRLPHRVAVVVADGAGVVLALAAHQAGFIPYAAIAAVLVFGAPWLGSVHSRTAGLRAIDPVVSRVAGAFVALGAGPGPWWLVVLIAGGYIAMGQLSIPPRRWFASWLPGEPSRTAADVSAGLVLVAVAAVIAL